MSVSTKKQQGTLYVTLEHPPVNVLNLAMLEDLRKLLEPLRDEAATDFVVLMGGGERAFSAGVDVGDHTREKVPQMLASVHSVIRTLLALPQVTVALVHGACLGGGCELATACDFIVAADDSFFATPEINVGCYPPVALARFPSQLGYRRAAEMILTGRRFMAQEALAMGLVNRVVPRSELRAALETFLNELRGKSSAVLKLTVRALREIALRDWPEALKRSEEIYLNDLLKTEDVEEGVRAFLEKRKPAWKHR